MEEQEKQVEERARNMGWVPKEDFRGDPEKWRDAETFVQRGENELPLLRERYRKLEGDFTEVKQTLRELSDHHKKVSEREYARAKRDLERQRDEAIDLADRGKVKEIDSELKELEKVKPLEKPVNGGPSDEDRRLFTQFVADNQWYQQDPEMQAYAKSQAGYVEMTKPHLLGTQGFYDEVLKRVKKEFPEKFTNRRRESAAAVNTGGAEGGSSKGRGKSYHDLPAEGKAACDRFVKQKLMTREEYVSEYFGE